MVGIGIGSSGRGAAGGRSAGVVGGILVDVALRQVAAVRGGLGVADAEGDLEVHRLDGERRAHGRLVEVQALAAAHHRVPVDPGVGGLRPHPALHALADRHEQPPDVGVGAVHHRLHERAVDDGLGDAPRVLGVGRAAHVHAQQVLGALAIARQHLGHAPAALGEHALERRELHRTGEPVGEQRAGVRRARVAVHREHVERPGRGAAQHRVERRGIERRVGEDVGQHRRHVRLDHPRALRHPGDGRVADARAERLGVRVGRHDPLGTDQRVVLQVGRHADEAALDLLDREAHADDAGGGDEHAVGRGAELRGRGRRHAARVVEPALARGDVAHLAVGDDGAQPAPADGLAPEDDRRAGEVVAREHGGRGGVHVAREEREVPGGGLQPAVAAGGAEAAGKDGPVVELHRGVAGEGGEAGAGEV
jgi:hypothetical protein